jgi:retinol dehydrogenase 12
LQSFWHRYGQSKLAIIHLANDMATNHPSVTTVSVHPGRVRTALATGLCGMFQFMKPLERVLTVPLAVGARNALWAATAKELESGRYYEPVGVPDRESRLARDGNLMRMLAVWTEEQLKEQV